MKRRILALLFAAVLTAAISFPLAGCGADSSEAAYGCYEGMDIQEFRDILEDKSYFAIVGYYFFEDENGNHCVAYSEDYKQVNALQVYPASGIDKSDKAFEAIKEGMTVFEVVEKVGVPTCTHTSGMCSLGISGDSHEYSVYIDQSVYPATVSWVSIYETDQT